MSAYIIDVTVDDAFGVAQTVVRSKDKEVFGKSGPKKYRRSDEIWVKNVSSFLIIITLEKGGGGLEKCCFLTYTYTVKNNHYHSKVLFSKLSFERVKCQSLTIHPPSEHSPPPLSH